MIKHISLNFIFRQIDLSYNRIRKIQNLDHLTRLERLFLASNMISKIENLDFSLNLQTLELGFNKITVSK
jgi:protein phosphatase 1 regulatory subunit 7